MNTNELAIAWHEIGDWVSRRLRRWGVPEIVASEAAYESLAEVYEKRPPVLGKPRRCVEGYVLVCARNMIVSAKRRQRVAFRYREVMAHAMSPGIDTARYAELMLLLVEWRAAERLSNLERELRSLFLETRSPTEFGRRAGLDWRVAARKYRRLRESFCDHLGIGEDAFMSATRGRDRAA